MFKNQNRIISMILVICALVFGSLFGYCWWMLRGFMTVTELNIAMFVVLWILKLCSFAVMIEAIIFIIAFTYFHIKWKKDYDF